MAKEEFGERSQMEILLSVLRLLDQQQTDQKMENAKLSQKIKNYESERILINLSQSSKLFDIQQEWQKTTDCKRQIQQLHDRLKGQW